MFARSIWSCGACVPALALACTMGNPAFDPPTGGTESGSSESGSSESGSSESGSSESADTGTDSTDTGPEIGCTQAPPGMVCIERGLVQIGCYTSDPPCSPDELPAHEVQLSSYFIDLYEVTVGEYGACMEQGDCAPPAAIADCTVANNDPSLPINCVSWHQAQSYCYAQGKQLPTEAQWERAAGGPTPMVYPWGSAPPSCDYAIISTCDGPKPVGSAPAGVSPDGLHDMIGNVSEWIFDWHDPNYYEKSPAKDPQGPATGNNKGARGGSFETVSLAELELFDRGLPVSPDVQQPKYGFRCAMLVPPP